MRRPGSRVRTSMGCHALTGRELAAQTATAHVKRMLPAQRLLSIAAKVLSSMTRHYCYGFRSGSVRVPGTKSVFTSHVRSSPDRSMVRGPTVSTASNEFHFAAREYNGERARQVFSHAQRRHCTALVLPRVHQSHVGMACKPTAMV